MEDRGWGKHDDKEARVLNGTVRWTADGLGYEADPRQAERLLEELDLDGEGVTGVVTPGVKVQAHQVQREEVVPESEEHTWFRALAARANVLAAEWPDVMYAANEICGLMSKPTDLAVAALKRLGKYLRDNPRLVFSYARQEAESIDVYSDTG